MKTDSSRTYRIVVSGLVQGVGFRPFVYRLAVKSGLKGWVNNTNENVQIAISTDRKTLEEFIECIRGQAPPATRIESIETREVEAERFDDFRILESQSLSDEITEVSPDIAVCGDCLEDMKRQPSRLDYPFLNCTNCGPRFTLVQDLPYDRARTTMHAFAMCDSCRREYDDAGDRRFHAQPTACRNCGPVYSLVISGRPADAEGGFKPDVPGEELTENAGIPARGIAKQADHARIASRTAALIDQGGIVAVKGLGGFFMVCDAGNEEAVRRLRASKHREGKPFAVMFRDPDAIREFCLSDETEMEELQSWRRPIVILRNRPGRDTDKGSVSRPAPSVSNGFPTTGAMLPYMPFHYMLFERLETPAVVMTSGNLAEEPILIDNGEAEKILGPVSDAVLHYNRDIHNRCDDSVGQVVKGGLRMLRRSRGYVPNPVRLGMETEGIFASGAELVNCFAMGKGKEAILSQHIGDLKNFETYEFYRETYGRFEKLFRLEPSLAVHDLHPDYLSTRFAQELGLPTLKVQHHHAHIASVLAEHRLDEKVIGVSFDGTGLGDDGNIWGSEFLVCDLESYDRISHLEYIPMPGGDRATREPWRMAVSYLFSVYGRKLTDMHFPFLEETDPETLDMVIRSIEKKLNSPLSCGAGRLFDAVSAMLGLCTFSKFHAEAPMRLEAAIRSDSRNHGERSGSADSGIYPFHGRDVIEVGPVIESITGDLERGLNPGEISARFHNTVAVMILDTAKWIRKDTGIGKICLAGGSFQNRYLSGRLEILLEKAGFEVLLPLQMPPNDGGIALGQLAVAAKRKSLGLV